MDKRKAETVKPPQKVTTGEFSISEMSERSIWIERTDGEGSEFSKGFFDKFLSDFFDKYM